MDQNAPLNDYLNLFSKTSTFLSIDVVDSTLLKSGENEQDAIYTFLSYHKLIRDCAYTHHGEVINIAGDGMMCRFERPDDAANAMRTILNQIQSFNKRQNRLSRPFALRLGLNTGQVMESQSLSAGQLISHTLDVAAKLQQSSLPNQARLSQECVSQLQDKTLSLTRLAWDTNLKTTVYQYSGSSQTALAPRVLPSPVRILVLEDELDELVRLKKILWSKHHETLPVYDVPQATLSTATWKPHVILLSADLAWEAGWDFLKGLRSDAKASQIPVILLSHQSTGDAVEKCFSLGGNGFLRKPLDEQQIVKRVDMVLKEFYL
jgi:class 3 adenylate cyclase